MGIHIVAQREQTLMAVNIVVPEMGESVVDARVARWLKKAGDSVTVGEALVELETDKVDIEVAASKSGTLGSIAHPDGADVKIGDVLGTIEDGATAGPGSQSPEVPQSAEPEAAAAGASSDPVVSEPAGEKGATPSARREARERDVPLAAVKSDGPRVRREDVRKVAGKPEAPPPAAPAPPAAPTQAPVEAPAANAAGSANPGTPGPRDLGQRVESRVRMSKRRATIARRLVEVQSTAAMLTTFNEVDMTEVMALRARHKDAFKETHGVSLGISSFFVKAAVAALREYPRLNAEIQGDEMVLKSYYDIGVAVSATEGLVVPVLRDAGQMSFPAIELAIRDFAKRAGDNTLALDDLKGGTFTITNGGVFGSLMSTPILNPPQVGILGLHAIKDRPVGIKGQIVLRPMMYTALTYDHRIVDGSEAVRFLVTIKELVEDPGALLLES
ncbi:MAG TPA: 2-oxoglutarate dehydrogenase complex dihydrolipoyllysine-residue succinyltransferase [Vicinamibacterales bacterium]|nr:2-oxoglutarate dehydrogenase complex dihydrolipoyllysine-residue succinyltransferase [Vicinamibacterales bacterium]